MKIVVLGGGDSTERDVSIRSAAAVAKNLEVAGFEVVNLDPANDLSKIEGQGDMAFPILHGQGGEDGSIQQFLENLGIPYLGTDSSASIICFDKSLTRQKLQDEHLPIAKGGTVTSETYQNHKLKSAPHVLKVSHGGSSIGTYIVRDPNQIDSTKVKEVFNLDSHAVIEELVEGTEITVSILNTEALPVIEIVPPLQQEFDYDNKYNGKTKEICPPTSINLNIQKKAQDLAIRTHKVLKARHLSRIDMIIKPNSEIIILELNTMPGMTEQSLYPLAARNYGLDMPELMKKFVEMVKRDYKLR